MKQYLAPDGAAAAVVCGGGHLGPLLRGGFRGVQQAAGARLGAGQEAS